MPGIWLKRENNRMLIGVLEQVIEYRNGESGIHVSHIKILTEMLLDKLMQKTDKYNLSWSQRMMIITSSALHDIGKVGIEENNKQNGEANRRRKQ